MKENLTEIVFILDRSGSMGGLETDTIGGFNAMLERQKKAEGEALLSTLLFSNETEVLHDRADIRRVEPLSLQNYRVGGSTALLDAIGGAIRHIGNLHRRASEDERPAHTLFVITTDGQENASRRYSYGGAQAAHRAAEGNVRLGVPVSRREYGCRSGGKPLRHPCGPCGSLPL